MISERSNCTQGIMPAGLPNAFVRYGEENPLSTRDYDINWAAALLCIIFLLLMALALVAGFNLHHIKRKLELLAELNNKATQAATKSPESDHHQNQGLPPMQTMLQQNVTQNPPLTSVARDKWLISVMYVALGAFSLLLADGIRAYAVKVAKKRNIDPCPPVEPPQKGVERRPGTGGYMAHQETGNQR